MSTTSTPQLESIEGIVERITFHSDESGYTVARFKVPRTQDLVTIIGNFAQIEAGQTLKLSGLWREHPKFGQLTDLIPQLGFNPIQDVQVLCPLTRGVVGTRNLNQVLQNLLNPAGEDKAEVVRGGITLRVGDRLIQRVNDYEREVFNGDLGVIVAIEEEEQEVRVQFDQRMVTYGYADLNEVDLAWAVTIHKSQGSEYPVVILPLFPQHYLMLSRNLLYTGLTRASVFLIVQNY